ncbi:uridylate kinase [Streptococcus pneumoniae]|nr:uridylate kinase [Streptococcus pneumoniae]
MANPKYKRILIKLSGEALAGERGVGIDIQRNNSPLTCDNRLSLHSVLRGVLEIVTPL